MRWIPKHAKPRNWFGSAGSSVIVLAAGACVCVVALGGIWIVVAHGNRTTAAPGGALSQPASPASASAIPGPATGVIATPRVGVYPVSLDIPAIKLHTTLQTLGLDASGSLEPPTNLTQAGWYTGSAVPGLAGPAIIAGHVDSVKGPAVFFNLRSLSPGDTITVALSSGRTATFRVMTIRQYAKALFPTAEVYGARPDPELRLITCGGNFKAGHYVDNVVVYAAEYTTAPAP